MRKVKKREGRRKKKRKKDARERAAGTKMSFLNGLRKATSTPVGYALCSVSRRNDRFNYRTCERKQRVSSNFYVLARAPSILRRAIGKRVFDFVRARDAIRCDAM